MTTQQVTTPAVDAQQRPEYAGRVILAVTVAAFVAVGLPVVWRGAPLGDDFNNCLAPLEHGLGGFFAASWERLGMVRPARFLEIALTTGVCQTWSFGVAIAVPLLLTLAVALLVRGLLRDLGAPDPWADIGAALWLLQPLGTEAALWPAALHVPLGLALALAALRLHHRDRHAWAALATLGAALSVEQVILALPLAAWLVSRAPQRRRAVLASGAVTVTVLALFLLWPGADPRLEAGLLERVAALGADPVFYIAFPAVGLGVHSIPLAVSWAIPWSVALLAGAAALGAAAAARLPVGSGLVRPQILRGALAVGFLAALANVPVLLALPRQGSPRIFTPTWLLLATALALVAARMHWRRPRLLGAIGGMFAAGAILSLALSVSVRLASADFSEEAAHLLAARIPEGGEVAVCDVRRTVTTPAPRGAFAVHELTYDWAAEDALLYYTGRSATFRLAGELWAEPCPDPEEVDTIVTFDELLAGVQP